MLALYIRFAQKLIPFRPVLILLLFADILFVSYALLYPNSAAFNIGLLPALLTLLWMLLTQLFCQLFANRNDLIEVKTGVFGRFKQKFKRFFYHGFALSFSIISVAVIILTLRSLNIWLNS